MENTRQRKHLYKQAGIWLVALFVVLTAAFMRGKVNVKAAETDDITITRYVDGWNRLIHGQEESGSIL